MQRYSILFIFLLSPILSFASSQLCEKTTFIKMYRLDKVWTQLNLLSEHSQKQPLKNQKQVSQKMTEAYSQFQEQKKLKHLFNQLISKLSPSEFEQVSVVLGAYFNEYQGGIQQIEQILANRSDTSTKYSERAKAYENLLTELIAKFSSSYAQVISATFSLNEEEKGFLKKWSFSLVIEKPQYSWTESADALHRYLWDLNKENRILPSSGKMSFGPYWLESRFNRKSPGLSLNASIRGSALHPLPEELKELNIRLHFSPFQKSNKGLSIEICDFSLSLNPDTCSFMTFQDWCQRQ